MGVLEDTINDYESALKGAGYNPFTGAALSGGGGGGAADHTASYLARQTALD